MNHATLTTGASPALADRLPVAGLLALAMTGFICIVTETLPAGLLPQISAGLGISAALAGQMVTAYALGSLLAAIPLTIATRGWRRRNVLLLTIIGFLVFNTVTALSTHYWLTLAARFFAGMAAGLAWSLLAGYARRMVAPQQQGRALALAMVGTPVALSLGVPLGTLLGSLVGWRAAFWIISALTFILIAWVLAKVPDYPGQSAHERLPLRRVFTTPGVRPVLAVVIAWMLAHNILYTYIAPFVAPAGLAGRVDLVLLVFGGAPWPASGSRAGWSSATCAPPCWPAWPCSPRRPSCWVSQRTSPPSSTWPWPSGGCPLAARPRCCRRRWPTRPAAAPTWPCR